MSHFSRSVKLSLVCMLLSFFLIPLTSEAYDFKNNLSYGMESLDVKALQVFLNQNKFFVASQGNGSPGKETSYFGPATRAALARFQVASAISPAVGFFGPITRGKISGSASIPVSSTAPTTLVQARPIAKSGRKISDPTDGADTTAPGIPTALNVIAGDGTTTLTWNDPVDADFHTVKIYRGTVSGSLTLLTTIAGGVETYSDSSLANNTTYYYALSSVDTTGNESTKSTEDSALTIGLYDIYVDSVGGSNSNDGTSDSEALQTLAAARTAALAEGNGARVGLKRGSTWREELNLASLSGVVVAAYGTGLPPVVTGLDIKTGWTQDGTFTNLWYVDFTHNTNGSNRSIIVEDNHLMERKTSLALANSNPGSYYSPDASGGATLRAYIYPSGNPNTNGKVYEVATRQLAVFLGPSSDLTEIVARGAMSNNGPIEAGVGSTLRRCLAAFGTKHNMLLASGVVEDCMLFDSDALTLTEPGATMFVGFTADATGLSITMNRLLAYTTRTVTSMTYAHTLNDPIASHQNFTCNECVLNIAGNGSGFESGSVNLTLSNSTAYGTGISAPISAYAASSTVVRFMGRQGGDIATIIRATSTWSQVALERSGFGGGSYPPITIAQNAAVSVYNTSISTPASYSGAAIGWGNQTGGTVSINRSILFANNTHIIPPDSSYGASNNNVFIRTSFGPYVTYHGTFYDLSNATAFNNYRATTTRDANSIGLTTSVFTGDTATGDFRINTSTLTGAGHDGDAGVTEHWDYNTRQIVSGPPQRYPVIPTTYDQSIQYIQDPEAWDFYP